MKVIHQMVERRPPGTARSYLDSKRAVPGGRRSENNFTVRAVIHTETR